MGQESWSALFYVSLFFRLKKCFDFRKALRRVNGLIIQLLIGTLENRNNPKVTNIAITVNVKMLSDSKPLPTTLIDICSTINE